MINYHANFQSTLYSYNQGSLFHRNGKAGASFLAKPMAQAIIYLNNEVESEFAREKVNTTKIGELFLSLHKIDRKARKLGLSLQVARTVDTLRRQGFLRR